MKNVDEFVRFVSQDCQLDAKDLGTAVAEQFGGMLKTLGLTSDQLASMVQVVTFIATTESLNVIRRYHEWVTDFPETP